MSCAGSTEAPLLVTVGECLGLVSGIGSGGLEYGTHAEVGFGGAEGNVAICANRLGARACWVGRVGADVFGQRILRTLQGEGVLTHGIIDESAPTAMMLKERIGPGRTRVSYLRVGSVGSRITPEDVPAGLLERAAVLHVTGITLGLSDQARETVFRTVERARELGVTVSFDVNHRSKLWHVDVAAPVYRELACRSDILFAGLDEAAILVGEGSPSGVAARLNALGPNQVVIKLGERGAYALIDDEPRQQSAFPVEVMDTVGAGDAFVGGYLAELMRGATGAERLKTAAASGALACQRSGDWESMPTRAHIEDLLTKKDPVDR